MQLCKYLAEPKFTFFKTGVIEKEPEKVCANYKNNEKKGQADEENLSGRKCVLGHSETAKYFVIKF